MAVDPKIIDKTDPMDPKTMASELLEMIKEERFHARANWELIGSALSTIFSREPEGLTVWIRHSERNQSPYTEECAAYYATIQDEKITIRTLGFWAQTDAPTAYQIWRETHLRNEISRCLEELHQLRLAHTAQSDQTTHSDHSDQPDHSAQPDHPWYEFKDGQWHHTHILSK